MESGDGLFVKGISISPGMQNIGFRFRVLINTEEEDEGKNVKD